MFVTMAAPHHHKYHRGGLSGGISGSFGYGFGYEPQYQHEYIYPPIHRHQTFITSYPDFYY